MGEYHKKGNKAGYEYLLAFKITVPIPNQVEDKPACRQAGL